MGKKVWTARDTRLQVVWVAGGDPLPTAEQLMAASLQISPSVGMACDGPACCVPKEMRAMQRMQRERARFKRGGRRRNRTPNRPLLRLKTIEPDSKRSIPT